MARVTCVPCSWSLFIRPLLRQLHEPNCIGGQGDAGGWDRVFFSYKEDDVFETDTDLQRHTVEPGAMWC